ncbi:MAG TPA: STAS domain-containing protein [Mycobacteriales bacterium]|nr:STAS domain-containing protein [Mycobacteriales bacterium]
MASARRSTEQRHTVIYLRGEHDLSTVHSLTDELAPVTATGDADVVLDLSGLRFLDASTVGVIVHAAASLRSQSRTLTLRRPPAFIQRVLDLCGVAHLVETAQRPELPDPAAALASWVAVPLMEPDGHDVASDQVVEDPDRVSTGRR